MTMIKKLNNMKMMKKYVIYVYNYQMNKFIDVINAMHNNINIV